MAGSQITLKKDEIRAIGFLLSNYEVELTYICDFQSYRDDKIIDPGFDTKFDKFLSDFRIARNIQADRQDQVLPLTLEWIGTHNPNDVDGFAEFLRGKKITTKSRKPRSLASKVLMLNDPIHVIPFDSRAKETLENEYRIHLSSYADFLKWWGEFQNKHKARLEQVLKEFDNYLLQIEGGFPKDIATEKVRWNRFVDKYLWTRNGNPETEATEGDTA